MMKAMISRMIAKSGSQHLLAKMPYTLRASSIAPRTACEICSQTWSK